MTSNASPQHSAVCQRESGTVTKLKLPLDVVLIIFEVVLADPSPKLKGHIITLLRLSRWIHSWVEKRIYRTVVLKSQRHLIEYLKSIEHHPPRRTYLQHLCLMFAITNYCGNYWSTPLTKTAEEGRHYCESLNFSLPPHLLVLGVYQQSFWSSFDISRLTHLRVESFWTAEAPMMPDLDWRITHFGIGIWVNGFNIHLLGVHLQRLLISLGPCLKRFAVFLSGDDFARTLVVAGVQSPILVVLEQKDGLYGDLFASDDTQLWRIVDSEFARQNGHIAKSSRRVVPA